jgi:predicted anti-sigma-YlaC factor YlaD
VTSELTCQDASHLLSRGQDEALPAPELTELTGHLSICEACRQVEAQLGFLRRAMRALGQDEPPTG